MPAVFRLTRTKCHNIRTKWARQASYGRIYLQPIHILGHFRHHLPLLIPILRYLVYHVDFKFRSQVLQLLIGATFADRAVATMSAFKRRAHLLYGGQS